MIKFKEGFGGGKSVKAFATVALLGLTACTDPISCAGMSLQECENLANEQRERADSNLVAGIGAGAVTTLILGQTGAIAFPL